MRGCAKSFPFVLQTDEVDAHPMLLKHASAPADYDPTKIMGGVVVSDDTQHLSVKQLGSQRKVSIGGASSKSPGKDQTQASLAPPLPSFRRCETSNPAAVSTSDLAISVPASADCQAVHSLTINVTTPATDTPDTPAQATQHRRNRSCAPTSAGHSRTASKGGAHRREHSLDVVKLSEKRRLSFATIVAQAVTATVSPTNSSVNNDDLEGRRPSWLAAHMDDPSAVNLSNKAANSLRRYR